MYYTITYIYILIIAESRSTHIFFSNFWFFVLQKDIFDYYEHFRIKIMLNNCIHLMFMYIFLFLFLKQKKIILIKYSFNNITIMVNKLKIKK